LLVYFQYAIAGVLIFLFFQDWKYRAVDIRLLILLLGLSIGYNYYNPFLTFLSFLKSLAFVFSIVVFLFLYFSAKKGSIVNPINEQIGFGDILFFCAITPLFFIKDYVLFFTSGLIFSLVIFLISPKRIKKRGVPLAGLLSFFLFCEICVREIFEINIFNIGV